MGARYGMTDITIVCQYDFKEQLMYHHVTSSVPKKVIRNQVLHFDLII